MQQKDVSKLRLKIGWTQKQMASALGIASNKTISHWENGNRIPTGVSERILKLLAALPKSDLEKVTMHLEKLAAEGLRAKR